MNVELGQGLDTVLLVLGRAASNSLRSECLNLIVGLTIVESCDLPAHLTHLRFEVAQLLKKLS